jgi:hypothetical protein
MTHKISKAHNELIDAFLLSKTTVKPHTKQAYKNNFIRLVFFMYGNNKRKNILSISKKELIKKIHEIPNITTNARLELFKIFKYLLDFKGKSSKVIEKEITKLYDEQPLTNKRTNVNLLSNTITYTQLLELLNMLTFDNYILFYLLIKFNVRNMDLVIRYVTDKKLIKKVIEGKTDSNIIYPQDGHYIYVRSNYKTSDKYGVKEHVIKDDKFIMYMKNYEPNEYIFTSNSGKPRSVNMFTKHISSIGNKFYNGSNLNQQTIYKIITSHFKNTTNDYDTLSNMAERRGHTLDIQKNFYT